MATANSTKVRVLNASYEPLSSCRLSRAVALIERGEAVVEQEDHERLLTHMDGAELWPLEIRLTNYRKVPVRYGEKAWSKAGVLERDNYECAYCTKRRATTIDHIHPQSRGGKNTWENTIACCGPCNAKKADSLLEDIYMELRFEPTVPREMHFNTKK